MVAKIQKHIEIVRTSTTGLSSMSVKSSEALYNLLNKHYETVGITTVNTLDDLHALVMRKPDLVFIGLKYLRGSTPRSKVWVSEYLERHMIAHTGSPKNAIKFEQDKPLAKQRMLDLGIATATYTVINNGKRPDIQASASFPLFVKPACLGAGLGVDDKSIVHNQMQLNEKVHSLSRVFAADALVETYLSGREFSVAIIKDGYTDEYHGMPIELLPGADSNGDFMLSHRLKAGTLETPVATVSDKVLHIKLVQVALDAFHAIGARDYGRIDIRLDAEGVPHFLEANLIPCIIDGSGNFLKACMLNKGMDYETIIRHIVNLGLSRASQKIESVQGPELHYLSSPLLVMPAV